LQVLPSATGQTEKRGLPMNSAKATFTVTRTCRLVALALQTQIAKLAVCPALTCEALEKDWTRTHSCGVALGLGLGEGEGGGVLGLGLGSGLLLGDGVTVGLGLALGFFVEVGVGVALCDGFGLGLEDVPELELAEVLGVGLELAELLGWELELFDSLGLALDVGELVGLALVLVVLLGDPLGVDDQAAPAEWL
jgi:hypothetical protein